MENIQNYDIYLTKMSKTFFDKAWFMSHLSEDVEYIVDFGCADGSFMKFLQTNCPTYTYIGIDNNPKFINLTKDKGFLCYSSLHELNDKFYGDNKKVCLVLNSVLHEVFSYYKELDFISSVYEYQPKYIAIRDMMYNPIDSTRFYLPHKDYEKIIELFNQKYSKQWNEFRKNWFYVQNEEQLITHFLLKYMYAENWWRELKENYLPIDIKELRDIFNQAYSIDFQSFYKLPYLVNKWKQDFELDKNFELNEFVRNINTHYKMLLVKEN